MLQILMVLLLAISVMSQSYPPADGFNQNESDPEAISVADSVMLHLGGYENWNNTRYLSWNFFGRRSHVWDKWTGRVRIENGNTVFLMNINEMTGAVFRDSVKISDPDTLQAYLKRGKSMWINDSYWMFMPYKLKNSGVTLKYLKALSTNGNHVLELTFDSVGDTPQNKYHVTVNADFRVTKWAYFPTRESREPRFETPWANWKKYGNIMLSDDRGRFQHSGLEVKDELPDSVFTDL